MPRERIGERPYRSHLLPACLACRRRKSRCKSDGTNTCSMCETHSTECVYPQTNSPQKPYERRSGNQTTSSQSPVLIARSLDSERGTSLQASSVNKAISVDAHNTATPYVQHASISGNTQMEEPLIEPSESITGPDDLNPHIIGPATLNDTSILEDHLSSTPRTNRAIRMVRPLTFAQLQTPSSAVMFRNVRKRPVGVQTNHDPAFLKLLTIEKLLEPFALQIVQIYFNKANICLPLLDPASFFNQYQGSKERLSSALLACLYANAMIYWHSSDLAAHRRPDVRYIWNLANEALSAELQNAPGISTIVAILLNVSGRPTTSMIGNAVSIGAAVSLCHSLGLNRDPGEWQIPQTEKSIRRRIWHALVLFDTWSSLSYGTPTHIVFDQYDVQFPEKALHSSDVVHRVYVALVSLTQILAQLLKHLYNFNKHASSGTRSSPLRTLLYTWEESLEDVPRHIINRGTDLATPGSANLRLCYLSVRLQLLRIEMDNAESHDTSLSTQAQRAAEDIVNFTSELTHAAFAGFWLSLSAFSFASATSFLIRRTIENRHLVPIQQSSSLRLAQKLISSLQSYKQTHGFDLGDICISQYADVLDTLSQSHNQDATSATFEEFLTSEVSVDEFFPSLWDMFET